MVRGRRGKPTALARLLLAEAQAAYAAQQDGYYEALPALESIDVIVSQRRVREACQARPEDPPAAAGE